MSSSLLSVEDAAKKAKTSSSSSSSSLDSVLSITPSSFKITIELGSESKVEMSLSNVTDKVVAFKVKTTAPKRYLVRPTHDYVQPKETKKCSIVFGAVDEYPDVSKKDKFLVQSIALDAVEPDLSDLWRRLEKQKKQNGGKSPYHEQKLKCKLIIPAATRAAEASQRGAIEAARLKDGSSGRDSDKGSKSDRALDARPTVGFSANGESNNDNNNNNTISHSSNGNTNGNNNNNSGNAKSDGMVAIHSTTSNSSLTNQNSVSHVQHVQNVHTTHYHHHQSPLQQHAQEHPPPPVSPLQQHLPPLGPDETVVSMRELDELRSTKAKYDDLMQLSIKLTKDTEELKDEANEWKAKHDKVLEQQMKLQARLTAMSERIDEQAKQLVEAQKRADSNSSGDGDVRRRRRGAGSKDDSIDITDDSQAGGTQEGTLSLQLWQILLVAFVAFVIGHFF